MTWAELRDLIGRMPKSELDKDVLLYDACPDLRPESNSCVFHPALDFDDFDGGMTGETFSITFDSRDWA